MNESKAGLDLISLCREHLKGEPKQHWHIESLPSDAPGGAVWGALSRESHPYVAYAMEEREGLCEPKFSAQVCKEKKISFLYLLNYFLHSSYMLLVL